MMQVSFDFTGSNFIVTGASSGIGRQIVLELLQANATVLGIARRQNLLDDIQADYKNFQPLACDVRSTDDIKSAVEKFVESHGKFHGLVYAAGIATATPLRTFDDTVAKEIMDVNFFSAVNLIKLVNRKKFAEVNFSNVVISSISAYVGGKSILAYAASKSALKNAVTTISKEIYATGARINSISPGLVETDMIDSAIISQDILNKSHLGIGKVDDISGMVLFLLSDRAKWITGSDFVIDGGHLHN